MEKQGEREIEGAETEATGGRGRGRKVGQAGRAPGGTSWHRWRRKRDARECGSR